MATNVHKIIEKQVNFWRIQRKKRESLEAEFVPANLVTLSNAYGSNGVGIAHRVAEQLDVQAYDREIVEHIATSEGVQIQRWRPWTRRCRPSWRTTCSRSSASATSTRAATCAG